MYLRLASVLNELNRNYFLINSKRTIYECKDLRTYGNTNSLSDRDQNCANGMCEINKRLLIQRTNL